MKRMLILVLSFLMLITGCTKSEEQPSIPSENSTVAESTQIDTLIEEENEEEEFVKALLAVSVPANVETYTTEDGAELFSYTSQHMQLILPNASVAEKVVLDFLNKVDTARADAENILSAAKSSYANNDAWIPYYFRILYSPTRIDYGVLSMFGTQNSFSGGMHGNNSGIAVNYDLMTGDVLTLGSIMHADATKDDFIHLVNKKLESIKDEYYLYDDYTVGVQNRLGGDENLYEDFFFTTTGLNFFFSPYEIAPHASGIITVEIPYNELVGLIYDGYFPEERQQIDGKMCSAPFDIANADNYNNMAEVNLAAADAAYVVYPDGDVENIRILVSGDMVHMPDYIVFAAYEMSGKDAVIINLDHNIVERISVHYSANNENYTIPLSN